MRSKIEVNEYKDDIHGFIFNRFLSDREEAFAWEQGASPGRKDTHETWMKGKDQ